MMLNNIGNIFRVVHTTGCDLKTAEEALAKCNSWPDTINYAKKLMQ